MSHRKVLPLRVDQKDYEALVNLAVKHHLTVNEVARRALHHFVTDIPDPRPLLAREPSEDWSKKLAP